MKHDSHHLLPRTKTEASRTARGMARLRGFTLTELLIVITIIAVLAALVTVAARNALVAGRRTAILTQMESIATAIDNIKNEKGGSYPPNATTRGMNSQAYTAVRNELQRAFKKRFPRINNQELALIPKLIGSDTSGTQDFGGYLNGGLSGAEALVFWLSAFSDDQQFPISGDGGPSFVRNSNSDLEVIEKRKLAFDFDLTKLGPRDDGGNFAGRYIEYEDPRTGDNRRINFWTYRPGRSEQPLIYLDTSNDSPSQYWSKTGSALGSTTNPLDPSAVFVYALRMPLETATGDSLTLDFTKYVNQRKFQLLHCGVDDLWGEQTQWNAFWAQNGPGTQPAAGESLLYPEGPFLADMADNLLNGTSGTLEEASRE
jgi:prepilin-type N-terminal cleavage/methylation domain-containing protein